MMEQEERILVVDDEERIRRLLRMYLEKEGYIIDEAEDGDTALKMATENDYTLIVLDVMLPGMDGIEVCSRLRQVKATPVILLTAKGEETNRVHGFEAGADDYVVKPFSPRELVARVKAVLRRQGAKDNHADEPIVHPGLVINPMERTVLLDGQPIRLTPKEFDLLALLAAYPGKVFPRERLLQRVWGHDYWGDERTIDVHITRLREKLGRNSGAREYISTVWGIGYKFEVAERN